MKAYHVQGPGGQSEPRSEDDGGEADDGWVMARSTVTEVRCCAQDDRGQVEVMGARDGQPTGKDGPDPGTRWGTVKW